MINNFHRTPLKPLHPHFHSNVFNSANAGPESSLDKPKILTIDDSPDMLYLEKIVLEREGYEVFTADSAESALQMLPNIPDLSLILCDVQMDNMDGVEFVKVLEEKHQDIFNETPVVLVTGLDSPPKANVAGYISKPSDVDEFLSNVKRFLFSSETSPA